MNSRPLTTETATNSLITETVRGVNTAAAVEAEADQEDDDNENNTLGKSSEVLRKTNPFLTDVKGENKSVQKTTTE